MTCHGPMQLIILACIFYWAELAGEAWRLMQGGCLVQGWKQGAPPQACG